MLLKRFLFLICVLFGSLSAADTQVSVPSSGTATLSQLTAGGSWAGNIKISWNIYVSDYVHYVYTISKSSGSPLTYTPDFAILEVSNTITSANLANTIFNPDPSQIIGPMTFSPSGYTPGMPSSIYGLAFYPFDSGEVSVIEFISTRTPMWGDIYLADDSSNSYVYNKKFGTNPALGASSFSGWVPVPSGQLLPVPEPEMYIILPLMLLLPYLRKKWREDRHRSAGGC